MGGGGQQQQQKLPRYCVLYDAADRSMQVLDCIEASCRAFFLFSCLPCFRRVATVGLDGSDGLVRSVSELLVGPTAGFTFFWQKT